MQENNSNSQLITAIAALTRITTDLIGGLVPLQNAVAVAAVDATQIKTASAATGNLSKIAYILDARTVQDVLDQ